ncbi:MAG: cobyrinate a,c-diamide synthase, partial [Synergistaceae bacterium]|nr:cobyrinate a,c-diamide synthase [Synergistaceae bacterium]
IIPERHLGLLPLNENMNYDFASVRAVIESCVNIDEVIRVSESSYETHGSLSSWPCASHKAGIAIARDEAFNFYYPESIETLKHTGAEIIYFSPLHDECIPKADGYIFGGGFPEIFARELEMNTSMRESVRKAANSGACILAECGGYMYLCDSLTDRAGKKYNMAGVIHCDSFMTDKPVIGYIEAKALSDNILCSEGDIIRGHEFHYSRVNQTDTFAFNMTRRRTGESYSGGYAHGNILASYLHMNFFGNIKLAERFLSRIDINQTSR